MVKLATVELELTQKTPSKDRHLRIVDKHLSQKRGKKVPAPKQQKPEAADDLDDMWDNVPV